MKFKLTALALLFSVSSMASAITKTQPGPIVLPKGDIPVQKASSTIQDEDNMPNFMDSESYDPNSPEAEKILEAYDRYYQQETGESPYLEGFGQLFEPVGGCYRSSCQVWAHVNKGKQRLYLYINGELQATWKTSTGLGGRTPNFDKHPDGRIYTRYTSKKFPGGNYNGLGNMPYAVFIRGGFAIHGTPKGNWKKLGSRASHGCIRIHPDYAKYFNALVRDAGISNVWITVD